ncbi:MAG: NHL repeat-containing protein [Myxococcaceae bacterium]|nr:NHL repeat-containing protein [Myxococcaceae bacterium]
MHSLLKSGLGVFCLLAVACGDLASHAGGEGAGGGDDNGAGGGSGADDAGMFSLKVACTVPGASEVQLNDPQKRITEAVALLFDTQGDLYVLDRYASPKKGRVLVFSVGPNRAWEKTMGEGVLGNVQDMTLDSHGRLHVLERIVLPVDESRVTIFNADGTVVATWKGRFDSANGLASDGQGHLYLSNNNVDVFTDDGVFERELVHEASNVNAPLQYPYGMVITSSSLWAADLFKHAIAEVVVNDGRVRSVFGSKGTGPGQFDGNASELDARGPTRIASDGMGNLYANDPTQNRIQKFSEQGDFKGMFSFGRAQDVGGLVVDPFSRNIYVGRRSTVTIVCPW